MSLKPGIANGWFQKFYTDVYPSDFVVLRGKKMKPPKYYDNLFLKAQLSGVSFEIGFDEVIENRVLNASKKFDDNTPDRLAVRESVQVAQISKLVRTL